MFFFKNIRFQRSPGMVAFFASYILLVYVHQVHFNSPTPVSRLDALHALVSEGTLVIDQWRTNTPDVAFASGHYYSDKAPGTLVLALPGFWAGNLLLKASGVDLESKRGWLVTSWTACAGIALITAFGLVKLAYLLGRLATPRIGWLTAAAIWFGAAPLPYSTMLFSHAHVVACIGLGLVALSEAYPEVFGLELNSHQSIGESATGCETARAQQIENQRNSRQDGGATEAVGLSWPAGAQTPCPSRRAPLPLVLAGLAFGWALNSEYTAGLVVVGTLTAIIGRNWRGYSWVGLGMVGPLLLIPFYSWLTVGSPFALPYSYQASFAQMKEGLYGIKWPDPATAFNLTFSSERGLFFWSPFLLCSFFGYADLIKHAPRLFWLTYAVPLLQITIISGRVWDWPAGPTIGPRYLAPILPLLALPCALGWRKFPKISLTAAFYSILITTVASLTDACAPYNSHPNPLIDFHVPLFLKQHFSPNLGSFMGLSSLSSVALFYMILVGEIWWLWRAASRPAERRTTTLASNHSKHDLNS